jgi:hypothetical protein
MPKPRLLASDCGRQVNRLEVPLDERFLLNDVAQGRVGDLARYRPGGGEFLLDEAEMRSRLDRLRDYLVL